MKLTSIVISALILSSTVAFGKANYKSELGLKDCTECHIKGKFKEDNSSNPLYATAKLHAKNLKEEVNDPKYGDYKGKKSCKDCHQGSQKPPAK